MQQKQNIISPENIEEDLQEYSIRPSLLSEFIGQKAMKQNLSIFIEAAKKRSDALDHSLLYGPPGLGKTTISHIISKEMGTNFKSTSGPALSKAGDLAAILTNLQQNDVLFIDEIHRLNINVEEVLYSALEDFKLDIVIGEGPSARILKIDLPKFTLVGATTRIGLISKPLRDRFGIQFRLEFYEIDELAEVIKRGAKILGIEIDVDAAFEIAKRSRGTPRIAIRLLRRVSDFALVGNNNVIDTKIVDSSLTALNIDKLGLDSSDLKYLNFILTNYGGGPVGIDTIAAGLSESRDSIEETIEPFLLKEGLINRTPRGRELAKKAYDHLNFSFDKENLLF